MIRAVRDNKLFVIFSRDLNNVVIAFKVRDKLIEPIYLPRVKNLSRLSDP